MIHDNLSVTTVRARITLIAPTFLVLARSHRLDASEDRYERVVRGVTGGLGYLNVGVAWSHAQGRRMML
jgi:hypothetical protein